MNKFKMYAKPVAVGLASFLGSFLAPFLVLLALPLIKWDKEITTDGMGRYPIVRGDLPSCLSWLGTPDERLPGGLYEPTVLSIYNKYGKWFTAWYWIGIRNSMHGFSAYFGQVTSEGWPSPADNSDESYVRGNLWWRRKPIFGGKFSLKMGYRIYHLVDLSWLAVPCFTITKK